MSIYEDLLAPIQETAYPTTFFPRCECGALKTWGAGPLEAGHSHWCGWSVHELKRDPSQGLAGGSVSTIPWFCELSSCMNPAGVCAISNGKDAPVLGLPGTVHWYCRSCWGKFVQAPSFSHHWLVSRP